MLRHQSPEQLEMVWAAEPMITRNQAQVEWKAGMSSYKFVGELSTPVRSNDSIVLTMENGCLHMTDDLECLRPILFAFFDPLPG